MRFALNAKNGTLIKTYFLPLLSGVIYGFAWNLDSLFFLQLISLVPLLIAFDTLRSSEGKFIKKLGKLTLISALFRGPIVCIDLIWMFDISMVALSVLILTEIVLFTAVFSIVLIKRVPFYATLCVYILYELLMQNVTILVPFYQLGYSWGNHINLVQYYSILGVEGGTLILLLVNFSFFKWYKSKKLQAFQLVSFSLFIGLTVFSLSKFYFSAVPKMDESTSISIIHAEFDSKKEVYIKNPRKLTDSVAEVASHNSLVVLPEVFYNSFGWSENLSSNRNVKHIDSIRAVNQQTFLVGAYLLTTTKNPTPQSRYLENYGVYYNSNNTSILLGDIPRVKSKKLFIPFYEYIPDNPIAQWINQYIANIGDERKVTILNRDDRFSYNGKRFNSMLCYESLYPMIVAQKAKDNQFLVVQTNEDWHNSDLLSDQYFKINKVNTIQIGIPVYRVSNYGYSAIINSNGTTEVISDTGKSFSLLEGNLPLKGQSSFYCNIVGYSYWLSGILLVYFMLIGVNSFFKQPKKK